MDKKDNDIINFETVGGWPICKMNLRDILKGLGATYNEKTNNWEIPETKKLDVYPRKLNDDGMGYGVNMEYVSQVSLFENNGETFCNIFTDKELDYMPIWKKAKTFPGDCFIYDDIEYMITDVDETDDGFVFICKTYCEEEASTKIFTLEEIKNILS